MRSERQEKAKEEAAPEIQYTQKEVAEMLQNAGDISRQQKKQDRNANVIAGFLVIGVAAAAWAAKIVNVGGGLILGGLVAAAFVSLWYFFQNLDDEESRKVYGAASILSIGILASLVNFVWGDQLAEFIPGGLERKEQIFWTLWYLFVLVMMMIGTIRCIRRQRQKKEKKYKTVLFTAIMATIMFVTLWQYQNTMQNRYKNTGIWRGAQQYAEVLLKRNKNLEYTYGKDFLVQSFNQDFDLFCRKASSSSWNFNYESRKIRFCFIYGFNILFAGQTANF